MSGDQFRILAIDGGGVRGYLSATILANIEQYLNEESGADMPIGARFDLIVGTSVGGLLSLGLALGKSAKDLQGDFETFIPAVFGKQNRRSWCKRLFSPAYDSGILENQLSKILGEKIVADLTTDACVTAVSLMDAKPRLHKTDYLARNVARLDERLVDIALATSAAPTYFSARSLKRSENLVDGGLTANNPALIALIDALQFERDSKRGVCPPSLEDGRPPVLLSIGTGQPGPLPYEHSKLIDGGWVNWAKPIIEVLMHSQSQLAHYQVKFLLKDNPDDYLRVDPVLNTPVQLDDVSRFRELKNVADIDADCERFLKSHFL